MEKRVMFGYQISQPISGEGKKAALIWNWQSNDKGVLKAWEVKQSLTPVGYSEQGKVQMQNVVRLEIEAYFSHGPMTHNCVMCQQKNRSSQLADSDYGLFLLLFQPWNEFLLRKWA